MRLETGYRNMVDVFRSAADIAKSLDTKPTAFAFWWSLYERQRERADDTNHPALLWSYGVSLVEQALIDAVCRAKGVSFPTAVRENLQESTSVRCTTNWPPTNLPTCCRLSRNTAQQSGTLLASTTHSRTRTSPASDPTMSSHWLSPNMSMRPA
ncbi:hypothetical protein ACFFQF_29130 [Haladaptatus pallidirubidus]|uniref:hypothetical protein n=1 Tax=Haladaptatus pallidirubidus TaxID=1008152 RepID=UPI0035EBF0EA